jgi:two-component system, LytTR family, response regulator
VSPPPGRLRAVIVDDEAPARALLVEYLAAHPEVEVVAECADGFAAVAAVAAERPDLLLLDVQMPRLSGFEVLELLASGPGAETPAVIFTTAFDEYAVRAFEVHAVDYLLKPFRPQRLAEALGRAAERRRRGEGQPLAALAGAARRERSPLQRVLVREGPRVHVLAAESIDYVEARGDYVRFAVGGRAYDKQQTLAELASLLDPGRFVRIHRSYLLNVERLARLELYAKDSRVAILADGKRLPVSRAGYGRLRKIL